MGRRLNKDDGRVGTGSIPSISFGRVRCVFTSKRGAQVKHEEVTERKAHVSRESLDIIGGKLDDLERAFA